MKFKKSHAVCYVIALVGITSINEYPWTLLSSCMSISIFFVKIERVHKVTMTFVVHEHYKTTTNFFTMDLIDIERKKERQKQYFVIVQCGTKNLLCVYVKSLKNGRKKHIEGGN